MLTDRVSQWIAAVTGAAIASAAELPGATSSLIAAICLTDGREFVLRLHTKDDWLALEPDVAVREASALTVLQTTGVAAPQLVAVDPDGASCGRPALLMSRLVGRADLSDASNSRVRALADALRPLHALRAPAELPAYRRYVEPGQHVVPTWASDPGLWETAFAVCAVAAPPGTTCLIHRDYHPGNVLIDDGAVAGIVDWVNACDGPPEVDIAHCRLNLALTHGLPSADEFATACTHPGSDSRRQAYWDVVDCLDLFEDEMKRLAAGLPPNPSPHVAAFEALGAPTRTDALMHAHAEAYLADALRRWETGD